MERACDIFLPSRCLYFLILLNASRILYGNYMAATEEHRTQ